MPRLDQLLFEGEAAEEDILQKLHLQDVKSVEALLAREHEISLDPAEWRLLFERIEAEMAAVPVSLADEGARMLLQAPRGGFSTGDASLDSLFGGPGLPAGAVVELIGRPSVGKSQMCMHCAVGAVGTAALAGTPPLGVVYVDCAASLHGERLAEMCLARGYSWEHVGGMIRRFAVFDALELIRLLDQLIESIHLACSILYPVASSLFTPIQDGEEKEEEAEEAEGESIGDQENPLVHDERSTFWQNVRLVVVDSLGVLLSTVVRMGVQADAILDRVASQLALLASRYSLAVLTVNYSRPDPDGGPDLPGLGAHWSYHSAVQIQISSDTDEASGAPPLRRASLVKAFGRPVTAHLAFLVAAAGLVVVPNPDTPC